MKVIPDESKQLQLSIEVIEFFFLFVFQKLAKRSDRNDTLNNYTLYRSNRYIDSQNQNKKDKDDQMTCSPKLVEMLSDKCFSGGEVSSVGGDVELEGVICWLSGQKGLLRRDGGRDVQLVVGKSKLEVEESSIDALISRARCQNASLRVDEL